MQRPSAKIFLLITLSLIIIGGLFLLVEYRNRKALATYKAQDIKVSAPITVSSTSTWNPNEFKTWQDSSDDATTDGKKLSTTKKTATSTEKETATSAFSKSFFSKYMTLEQNGTVGDKASQNAIIEEVLANQEAQFNVIKYKMSDIQTEENTPENLKVYGNTLSTIYLKYVEKYKQNQVLATESQINQNPSSFYIQMNEVGMMYKNLTVELSKITVPKALISLHTDFLNALYKSSESLLAIASTEKDPVRSLQGMASHKDATVAQENALSGISSYIISMGVKFTPSDPGYFLMSK
ncbi:MAG: hypothetical protein NTV72_00320 [Candidatus Taylorbacteria bacterium]|nr:hypothetical protein [Candidatus Taylorbacteria bacterium]